MKKLLLSLTFLILGLSSFAQNGSCAINTNGIYVARVDSSLNVYLKFYGKDSVLTTASEIPAKMSNNYITPDNKKYILHGTYKISGCFLKIKVEGMDGKAKLEGYIINQNIGLSKVNLMNNTYTDLFFFYKE